MLNDNDVDARQEDREEETGIEVRGRPCTEDRTCTSSPLSFMVGCVLYVFYAPLDNQAVAACVSSGTCRCGNVKQLIRALFLVCARKNFIVTAVHAPGTQNDVADALSRQDWKRFRELTPAANMTPTPELALAHMPGETSLQPCGSTHGRQ